MLHLNLEQLTKSLMTLFNLYEENRTSESIYENEAEFRSLYVLLHIRPDNQVSVFISLMAYTFSEYLLLIYGIYL